MTKQQIIHPQQNHCYEYISFHGYWVSYYQCFDISTCHILEEKCILYVFHYVIVATITLFLLIYIHLHSKMIGVSLKSQILHMMVFATRGLVIFIKFLNFYNLFMQGFYLSSTACIIYMITFVEPTKSAYSPLQDDFNIWKYAIIPSIFLTLIMSLDLDHFDVLKLLWTYSIIQDVTAMVPQLFIAHYNRRIQSEVKLAILFMGLFRCLNIINWIYLVYTESIYKHHWMIYICCVMQVAIYGDFFYHTGTYVLTVDCFATMNYAINTTNQSIHVSLL